MQSRFGCGFLFGTPIGVTTPSPIMFAAIQDVSLDFSQDLKSLYGGQKFPIEQAGGKAKIEGKVTVGRIDPVLFNTIYFGGTVTSSGAGEISSVAEPATIPAASSYTITAANAANYRVNLGVYNQASGMFMTQVAANPAAGQYTLNSTTGVYTFAAADAGASILLYYTYGATTGMSTLVSGNQVLGSTNPFSVKLQNSYRGKQTIFSLANCISTKLSLPFKMDDFVMPQFSFSAQDDGLGNVFTMSQQN